MTRIYIFRSDQILFANSRASDLTGYPHKELMEIRLWDLCTRMTGTGL